MKNSLKIGLVLLMVLFSTFSFAQDRSKREKIKTLKVAFITERLNLSTNEAQSFWPLYNEYEEKRESLRHRQWTEVRAKVKENGDLSEKEAQKLLGKHIELEKEEDALKTEFVENISKVISAKKTLLLLRSEEEFKRQLIKQYRDKKRTH